MPFPPPFFLPFSLCLPPPRDLSSRLISVSVGPRQHDAPHRQCERLESDWEEVMMEGGSGKKEPVFSSSCSTLRPYGGHIITSSC